MVAHTSACTHDRYDGSDHVLYVAWARAEDESGVEYIWSVGNAPGLATFLGPVNAGTSLSDTALIVLPASALPYFVTLVVRNTAGLESTASVQLIVDNGGPLFGWVIDGEGGVDQSFTAGLDHLICQWGGFIDPVSGIAAYYAAIGTDIGRADVAPFVYASPDAELRYNFSDLPLESGGTYFCVVRAVDGRGFVSVRSSNGITVEVTAPEVGTVFDGNVFLADIDVQDDPSTIWASWVREVGCRGGDLVCPHLTCCPSPLPPTPGWLP